MNRSKQALLIPTIVLMSVFTRYNSAIAANLKANDKKIEPSWQVSNFSEETNKDLKMNLMNPPDTIQDIKNRFYKDVVANNQESIDADNMWANAMAKPYWKFIKREIIFIDETEVNNNRKYVLITLMLDPEHKCGLSKQAFNIVQADKTGILRMYFDVLMESIEVSTTLDYQKEVLKALEWLINDFRANKK